MVNEADASILFGGAIGTFIFATKKLEELAKTTAINHRLVPPYLRYQSKLEQRYLNRADQSGAEPAIREDMIDE